MIASLLLDNLTAWSAQVCVLVAAGALAALTLTHPRARLLFWQGVLAIALLLPAVEPWHQPPPEPSASVSVSTGEVMVAPVQTHSFHFVWRKQYLLAVIALGAALRFLWICAGLFRLRRHRLDARMLTIPPVPFSNPRVRWFVSNTVGGPVTFGFLNPSILLPARVAELDPDLREAIAHHELEHVRRGDWIFVLAEEAIRGALWFHPAIWFVLSRIQLAREQVVDAEVVSLTQDRERYLDALVAVAAQRLLPDVAPAPLFLKKRQLAMRVDAVLKETRMSKPRLLLSFTSVCSAALIALRIAVWMFPLHAPAQTAQLTSQRSSIVADGIGVTVEPGAKILHRSPVLFPSGVTTSGTVIVESTVDAKGEVTDARVVSGPEELRNAALSSVLNWHFSTEGGLPPTVQSSITFTATAHASAPAPTRAKTVSSPRLTLRSIDTSSLSDELAEKVRASLPVRVGDSFGMDDLSAVQDALKAVDEHLAVAVFPKPPDATLSIKLSGASRGPILATQEIWQKGSLPLEGMPRIVAQESIQPSAPVASISMTNGIRVGANVQVANLIRKVVPLYPPDAKAARIQGVVSFTATIGSDGSVTNLQLISGHPLLVPSAMQAVKQWLYKPTLLNGQPVEVITQIDVNYTLSQ